MMARKSNYRHLFDEGFDEEDPSPRNPVTVKPAPPPQPILPIESSQDETPSLKSFNSYPSQPVSTPPTPKAEWTPIRRNRNSLAVDTSPNLHAGRSSAETVSKDSSDGELNAEFSERITRHPAAHPRPEAASRDQSKIVNQFYSNLVEKYVQQLLDKPQTGTWLDCPEFPTANELLDKNEPWTKTEVREDGTEHVVMDGNYLQGEWPSVDAYLSAHYGMLREEAVQPLRQAISWVRAYPNAPEGASCGGGIGIYSKVHITTITFSTRGLGIRVVFSLSKVGKKLRWGQSKRLISGTLVVLTPTKDMFRTKCIVATVAARPLDLVMEEPPKLDLFFARPDDIDIDPSIEYTMIEDRTSFFEAVRHIGLSLQKMTSENFPLAKHIVGVDDRVPPPSYILDRPNMKLSSVFESDIEGRYDDVDVLKDFPKNAKTSLDRSQQDALAHIFKKRVALIQGPPGTGKTHVSVIALKLLIHNMSPTDPPIVVACQTNHALDQLLRHVASFEENFIRLGGRSKDTGIVKQRTLYNVRQKTRYRAPYRMRTAARNTLKSLEDSMQDLLAPLEYGKDQTTKGFMQLETYRKAGILSEKQCDLLDKGDQEWAGPSGNGKTALAKWLGNYIQYNQRSYAPDNLGGIDFEEVDLEFEQLKEMEAENVCQDDDNDFESLSGNGFPIFMAISGKHSDVGEAQIEKWLSKDNLWKIPARHRGAVFNYIQRKAVVIRNKQMHELAARYDKAVMQHRYGGFENNAILLRQQKVVGVTTTGLSKYRGLIAAICPRVIMVEEAAETMEAPVTAGCVPSLEHLILVGDHKQLRPQCGVKLLEQEPFLLNVSMFERLVENKLPYKMLKRQRRMIPEIRRLLGPIYKNDIKDHILMRNPEVRPPVPGMGGINSFFYTHSWPDSVDDQMSSTNLQEADMVVGFYDYLISNGLKETEITVLCFYNGQRKLLLRRLRNHIRLKRMGHNPARIFKVLTVDSYQGEENEVVLLSLVRSNDQGKIGFLGVENRICVALSRAKRGFYMFGNAELLACESKLWAKVVNIMLADTSVMYEDRNPVSEPFGRVVFRVPLRCSKHCREMYIENVDDWDKIAGGCSLPCSEILKCGHHCHLNCHPFGHEKAICFEPCAKVLSCGHQCGRECYDQCRCTLCGNQRLENGGGVTRDESESSGSHGSNARAWQEFAKGGVRPHDAALRAMQRENYLQEQITLNLGADAASYQSSEMQNTTEDRKSTDPHSSIPAIRGSALLVDPAPLLVDSGALVTGSPSHLIGEPPATSAATAPTRKVKVSHRNRFKRSAPTATPIATSRAAAPVVATPAVMSAPPVDYTGAPTLQAPLEPLCLVHNDPLSARTASFETVVMPKCAEGAAAKYDGESLIDFD